MDESHKLIRHHLGAIDLASLMEEEKQAGTEERKEYCAAIFAVLPRIETDVKRLLYQQALFITKNAENWDQVVFGRGVFDGMAQLLEHWRVAAGEHMSRNRKEPFDPHEPIGTV